jgi:hypothetical protein
VHLAFLDETGTDGHSPIVMFGAVVITPGAFGWVERLHSIAIEQLFPVEEIETKFQEFHASELFLGRGAFEGIEQKKRFDAISLLLMAMERQKLPYIYAAVDRKEFAKSPAGTARPLDFAFRICALGVEDWARNQHPQRPGAIQVDYNDQYLFILDDTTNAEVKKQLRTSYRLLRAPRPYTSPKDNRLWHAHDEMYFGDSRDSIGIQLADICNYFMLQHLVKREGCKEFYEMFAQQAICARSKPEWTTFSGLLVAHDSHEGNALVSDPNIKSQIA